MSRAPHVSGGSRRGLTVKAVVTEQPRPAAGSIEAVTSGRFLPILAVSNRKSGFRSSQSRHHPDSRSGLIGSLSPDEDVKPHAQMKSAWTAPSGGKQTSRGPSVNSKTVHVTEGGEYAGKLGDQEDVQVAAGRAHSPADVDMCMGLNGLVLVKEGDDILVKDAPMPFTSVPNAIKDLCRSPWRKYYQRPPLNTPGLLAIGEVRTRWQQAVFAWCLGMLCSCPPSPPVATHCCCCSNDTARSRCNGGDGDDGMETLLVYHSDDIAVALNYCMQSASKTDASSPLHAYVTQLRQEDVVEEKLFVRWISLDGNNFTGMDHLQEKRPIHAQIAQHLGYWPRFNFYDHCLDIVKGIYSDEEYNPSKEYGMGCCQPCSVCSFHWRGAVPGGEGWNQRDENYYHM
ncbi:uncharacterized protein LOC135827355 [Sycon ciliatum]|uniref:uncharacterized protein LOC135827355 n=1 Tax=Sycon ciliatum TaxID=27933 RepID=UPI0020A8CE94|eukprot:scpid43773/ scgid11269/ 